MLARIFVVITLFVSAYLPSFSQVSIIPEPVSLQQKEGVYNLKTQIVIEEGSTNLAVKKIADWLKEKLSKVDNCWCMECAEDWNLRYFFRS